MNEEQDLVKAMGQSAKQGVKSPSKPKVTAGCGHLEVGLMTEIWGPIY